MFCPQPCQGRSPTPGTQDCYLVDLHFRLNRGSVPRTKRERFERCRKITSAARQREKCARTAPPVCVRGIRIKMLTGTASAAVIEATETWRVTSNVMTETPTPIKATKGISPKRAPVEVATPLPPLRPNHTGNECPITQEIAATIPKSSVGTNTGCTRFSTKIDILTAIRPFRKSTTKTG